MKINLTYLLSVECPRNGDLFLSDRKILSTWTLESLDYFGPEGGHGCWSNLHTNIIQKLREKNESFNSNFFGRLILQFRRGFRREPLIYGIIPFNGILLFKFNSILFDQHLLELIIRVLKQNGKSFFSKSPSRKNFIIFRDKQLQNPLLRRSSIPGAA